MAAAFVVSRGIVFAASHLTIDGPIETDQLARPMFNWDAAWYAGIVRNGYEYAPDGRQHSIAFFPVYPLLTRAIAVLMPGDGDRPIWLAQTLISNLCMIVAMAFVFAFTRRLADRSAAAWSLCLVAFFPPSLFLSAGYPEALFLALVCPAGVALLSGRIMTAAVLIGVATGVRPTGVAFVPTLLIVAWRHYRSVGKTRALPAIAAISVTGGLLYAGYLAMRFGSVGVYFDNFAAWVDPGRRYGLLEMVYLKPCWDRMEEFCRLLSSSPLRLGNILEPPWLTSLWMIATLIISINGLLFDRTVLRWFYLIPLLLVGIPYWSSRGTPLTFEAISRYLTAAYPMYAALGMWVNRGGWKPLAAMGVSGMAALLAYASYCFGRIGGPFVG